MICKVNVKFAASADEKTLGFGRGVVALMDGVERLGSIRQATMEMGMAYSKAWKILNAAEKELGMTLISRYYGTRSSLTYEGEQMLALYKEALDAAQKAADKVMKNFKLQEKLDAKPDKK